MSRPARVLIIDDDRRIVQAVSKRLQSAGYEVLTANDGEAGLAAAAASAPDAIVLDLRMPKLDGMGVLAGLALDARLRRIPVVVLSASAVDERKALDAGAYCFLPKPYDPVVLLQAVAAALGRNDFGMNVN